MLKIPKSAFRLTVTYLLLLISATVFHCIWGGKVLDGGKNSSHFDYCIALHVGITKSNMLNLQSAQNSVMARAMTIVSKFELITPVLKFLH